MTKIQAYFPEELYLEIKLLAKTENKNFSDLLRQIVASYIEQKKSNAKGKNKLKSIKTIKVSDPAFDGLKPEEISQKIDEIIYE